MKTLAIALALGFATSAFSGEVIKRELGIDSNGEVVEGYVFQADSKHRRRSSNSGRVFRPNYFYQSPVVIRATPTCRTTTVRTGQPIIVIPHRPAPIRARVIVPRQVKPD
ncbi:MAG: hypothetical protein ACI8UO_000982 [Verrucomicrobiales bacterium]|jgi:hypothetical protein